MCSGFTCTKNALTALNSLYILVSFALIGVAAYAKVTSIITSFPIYGGVVACGVFLFLISFMGIVGARKHNQVLLFFTITQYMAILFLLFVVQFSLACACLAMTEDQQRQLAFEGWEKASDHLRSETELSFKCCGFDANSTTNATTCAATHACCPNPEVKCQCPHCWDRLRDDVAHILKVTGCIGLFFSFTEFLGVLLTIRYRNLKDPRAKPNAFL